MPHWPHPLFLQHSPAPWTLDATTANVAPEALDGLAWANVFAAMTGLETGAIANPDEGRQVGHYWLRAPEHAPTIGQARAIGEAAEAVRIFGEQICSGDITAEDGLPFTDLVHIGIGGSALGPRMLAQALGANAEGLTPHFLDNTDPDGIAQVLRAVGNRLRHALFVVASKSGGTVETLNAARLAQDALTSRGLQVSSRFVAITSPGSSLWLKAESDGWLARFPVWSWIGGRTSITSAVGLTPAALCGIDIQALLNGAREMDQWTRTPDWRDNPAALLAGCWYLLGRGRGERNLIVLPYSDRLHTLSQYLQQLIMESVGKEHDLNGQIVHQGLTVLGNKGATDQHALVQQLRDGRDDFLAMFVQILGDGHGSPLELDAGANAGDFLQGFLLGTRRALRAKDRPSLVLTIPRIDAFVVGGLIALFERAVGFYGSLIGVNAYNQPGVEAGKRAAGDILKLAVTIRQALDDGVTIGPADLAETLGADPVEVHYILERLVATERAICEPAVEGVRYRQRLPRDG